ncbi:UTP--glucose-1-phosphate uridylyltransferase [Candidatus Azambacteria bacterium RIFCSPHIGHO2_02_FULL_52_12]|uniref:UTP--glucose-1-phosphate uridylyltransferase n=1 Tax=Candidatus Azambacteria bacterium RIFCSPLOWO2_01_FULL_46_25 TaxID=1797298 RepID=A0A1F5BTR4_9BACT|nr:MAG: UTP--glucose-1-phosphate uridylyltransferase [Candidatus Azambacteria bacterium RIFCSPHIGHO2_02_FULL_52_12]OGD34012.1 MAG: UTP--glucose-1-phosphate uridylyltransferase [Candidatus Azambacteria bacterium RIFCSPLOWO2_01_FULL_46_25]OGD36567.1 MAG: UTP--glucose-1-phosphate uridylyltransferase [Candidatus Azambacteria bacterium RIFCSPHIGHO2_01_FULL_51_74]
MIKKVIIPVAGLGTRFLPATKAQPKEMLPIVDKPIIQYLVEEAVASGITEVIFVTGRGKRAIEDHFDYAYELEQQLASRGKKELMKAIRDISNMASFTYVRQKEQKGDGDALLAAAHLVGDEPCAVLFGDDIVDGKVPCLKQMMSVFERYNDPVVALEEVPQNKVSLYGIVKATKMKNRAYEIKSIIEKPAVKDAPSRLAIVGKYIITPDVFDELRKLNADNGEIRLADALGNLLSRKPVYGYQFQGTHYDCGSKIGFLKAVVEFGLKHKEVKTEFKNYLKEKRFL